MPGKGGRRFNRVWAVMYLRFWDRKLRDRDFKISGFRRKFSNKCRHHFQVDFFRISSIFPTFCDYFVPANTTEKNSFN